MECYSILVLWYSILAVYYCILAYYRAMLQYSRSILLYSRVLSYTATVLSCYATVFTFMHAGIGLVGYTVSAVLSYDGAKQALLPHVVLCFKAAAVPRNTTSTEQKAAHVRDRTEGHGEEWRCTCVVSDSQ